MDKWITEKASVTHLTTALRRRLRFVDPNSIRWCQRLGRPFNKTLGMALVSSLQSLVTVLDEFFSLTKMDGCRGHQAQAGMAMVSVVPIEKRLAPGVDMVDGRKAVRVIRTVFEGFELSFRVGIVISGMRSGMAFGHAQIEQ